MSSLPAEVILKVPALGSKSTVPGKSPVVYIDERLSSVAAKKSLQEQGIKTGFNKGRVDETAAAIILQ